MLGLLLCIAPAEAAGTLNLANAVPAVHYSEYVVDADRVDVWVPDLIQGKWADHDPELMVIECDEPWAYVELGTVNQNRVQNVYWKYSIRLTVAPGGVPGSTVCDGYYDGELRYSLLVTAE